MAFGINSVPAPIALTETVLRDFIKKYRPIRGERPKRSSRIKKIAKLLEDDNFVMCDWAICHCRDNDTWYRVNGQHSSYSLQCLLDKAVPEVDGNAKMKIIEARFPEGIPVTIKECYCDTEDELLDVFDMFDNKMSARSDDDKLGVYVAGFQELRFTDKSLVKDALKGLDYLRKRDKSDLHADLKSIAVADSHDRGRLLSLKVVRDFISFMGEHEDATFPYRTKDALVAAVYEAWLPRTKESELEVEALLYEADSDAGKAATKIRRALAKKGHDAKWYWTTCASALMRIRGSVDKDAKALMNRVNEIRAEECEEPAVA